MSHTIPQIESIERAQLRKLPDFRVGDTIRVHYRIREGDKERVQVFQGVVLRRRRGGLNATFSVRKVSYGVGVERIFPLHSPRIEKIEVTARGHVRQSRLYYLRDLRGKKARLRESQRKAGDLHSLMAVSQEDLDRERDEAAAELAAEDAVRRAQEEAQEQAQSVSAEAKAQPSDSD